MTLELGKKVARLGDRRALDDSMVLPDGVMPTTGAGRAPLVDVLVQATKVEQMCLKGETTL